jgi:hypothetical protein
LIQFILETINVRQKRVNVVLCAISSQRFGHFSNRHVERHLIVDRKSIAGHKARSGGALHGRRHGNRQFGIGTHLKNGPYNKNTASGWLFVAVFFVSLYFTMPDKTPLTASSANFGKLEYHLQLSLRASTARIIDAFTLSSQHMAFEFGKRSQV